MGRIFPRQFDNDYRGHWLAVVLFFLIFGLKAAQAISSLIMTRRIMTGADALPIDTYGAAGEQAAIGLFATLSMYGLILPAIGLVALVRYRSMIPLLFLMLIAVQGGARVVRQYYPIDRAVDAANSFAGHSIGFWVNNGILAATVIGLLLSLAGRRRSA